MTFSPRKPVVILLALFLSGLWAGVRREIQEEYRQRYENRALFLKIPVRGARQVVFVRSGGVEMDRSNLAQPLAFRVGDQVRITNVNFRNDQVRFRLSNIDLSRESELLFQFPAPLDDDFQQRSAFDQALDAVFTQGLSYTEIDSAKEQFIKDQFDDLIDQFSRTTGTDREFVIQAISEKNPRFVQLRDRLGELEREQRRLQAQLEEESRERRTAQRELQSLRQSSAENSRVIESLKREREQLVQERKGLEQKLQEVQASLSEAVRKGQQHERRMTELMHSLDLKEAASADMEKRIQALARSIDQLKTERQNLQDRVQQLTNEVSTLKETNQKLSQDLRRSQLQGQKLEADLRDLTQDRQGLQARYLELKRQKESLELAEKQRQKLNWIELGEDREGWREMEIRLAAHPIARLRLRPPRRSGEQAELVFQALSPDTVTFSEEERSLYERFGKTFRVEPEWLSQEEEIQVQLQGEGKPLQEVAAREEARWSWIVQGNLRSPQPLLLRVQVRNQDGHLVPLLVREFPLAAGGWSAILASLWSPLPLLAGLVLGILAGFLIRGAGRRSPPQPAPKRANVEYMVQKKL